MKHLIVLALAASLAGCASMPSAAPDTPQQAVYAAKSAYATALTAAVAYKKLPACSATRPAPCSQPALVQQLQRADIVAAASLDAAEAAVRTPLVSPTAAGRAVQAAQAALSAMNALVTGLGVTQ
ncbi:MAG: hypothetical protein K0S48_11 [Ramlibacter sp.]|jgi:hypothetical protein|nr:hypothetical protein [Ramlibacter sp.]